MQPQKTSTQQLNNLSPPPNRHAPKTFAQVHTEIKFQQQKPIHLSNCLLSVSPQSSIIIQYRSNNSNQLALEIPFNSVLCIGKKSSSTTLLMLKDQEKEIERDQNGYELVSDEEDQQFEDKTNQKYKLITESLNQLPQHSNTQKHTTQTKPIAITQKCQILLTINPTVQLPHDMHQQANTSAQLYQHLSQEMEAFQKSIDMQTNKFNHFANLQQAMQIQSRDGQQAGSSEEAWDQECDDQAEQQQEGQDNLQEQGK